MRLIFFVFFLFIWSNVFCQNNKIRIGMLEFESLKKTKKFFDSNETNEYNNVIKYAENYIIDRLIEDKRFIIVERSKTNVIKKELELQKSENFMDGYVVEQGSQIGADYLMNGLFDPDSKDLILSLYSVSDNEVKYKNPVSLLPDFWGKIDVKGVIQQDISNMINKVFPVFIPVIEVLEGTDDARLVLVAGGSKNGFKDYDIISFYTIEEKMVDGKSLQREITVGKGKVIEVENENFSRVKIQSGGSEVKSFINNKVKVYCKLK